MSVLNTLKRNALVSIALGSLMITSFSTGNAEALFDRTKKALNNVGSKINCKSQCNIITLRKSGKSLEKNLNNCASICDVAQIKGALLKNCNKLNAENKNKLTESLNSEQETLQKEQKKNEDEITRLNKSRPTLSKSNQRKTDKSLRDLDKKQVKLMSAIETISGQMETCQLLPMAKEVAQGQGREPQLSTEHNVMPNPPVEEMGPPSDLPPSPTDLPPPLTPPPSLTTPKKLPATPHQPSVAAVEEEEVQQSPMALALQAKKKAMEEKRKSAGSAAPLPVNLPPPMNLPAPVAQKPTAEVAEETPKATGGLLAEIQAKKLKKMDPNAPRPAGKSLPPVQKTKEEALKEALAKMRPAVKPEEEEEEEAHNPDWD